MKIVCGSCQAKYSIADEKVAGKVFKIRCKRCGEVIVVRGDQDAAPEQTNGNGHAAAIPAAYEAPADAIWHVVINGEQAGPYAPLQLGELIHAGQLDWDAYVWCEGFENWLPMREVSELVAAISGQRGDDVTPAPVTRAVQPVGGAPSMGADPFADEAPPQVQVQMYAKPVAQAVGQAVGMSAMGGGGGGVAAQAAASMSAFDASPAAKVVASSPRVSAEQAMTGARNENSVLFSLKNLQALATGSSAPAAASPSMSNRPGYAGGEGSGLIDIRALATATGVNEQSVRPGSEKDALLSLGSAQAGAFGALGSPMLAPPGRSDDEGGKKGLMFAVLGGIAMLAVAGVAIAMIMKPAANTAPVAPMVQPPSAAMPAVPPPTAAPAQPSQPSNAAPEPPSEGEQRAAALAASNKAANEDDGRRGHGRESRRGNEHEKPAASEPERPVATSKPEPEAKPEKPAKRSGNSSIDDLLNDAIKGGGKPGASAASAPAANLPEKPTRDDVLDAMKGVQDAVKACSKGQSGVAFANVTVIGKTGRVSNVEVTGMTGDVGSCIARSVRKASFPKFKSENFQVKFPFRL
jgi:predicted Zn finger-like uncharacterized protein